MAIPADPTVNSVIAEGMVEGGQFMTVSGSAAHTAFKNNQFQTLKAELWAACKTDKFLETEVCKIAAAYTSLVSLPTDFDSELRVWLYDAPDEYRGTAQAGGAATITLASSFSASDAELEGRYVFITGGTGSGQYGQILSYNDTTKVVTVTANWTTQPDSTSTYLIGVVQYQLTRYDYAKPITPNARPRWYSRLGTNLYVNPPGDRLYPLLIQYRANLTQLDEVGSLLVKHLRERRSLWIAGIKYKTAERYDDDRAEKWKAAWEQAKNEYRADNAVYEQAEPYR